MTSFVRKTNNLTMGKLPSLEAMRVFEVAGRHQSYSRAAEELHVSHGAVSQRIRQLEERLGVVLFQRAGHRMELTSSGRRLHAQVSRSLAELTMALAAVSSSGVGAEVTVSVLPVMATRWLMPRLPKFNQRYPRIRISVRSDRQLANFRSDRVDIALRLGSGTWKGLKVSWLMDEEVFPVCSPHYNDGHFRKDPSSFADERLLIDPNVPWAAWFKSAGIRVDGKIAGNSFSDANLLIEAAINGQGLALARRSCTRSDLLSGRLVCLSEHSYRLPVSHFMVYPPSLETNGPAMAFRDWLLAEAAGT
ncbi:transcriptional regulator GcvA [Bradyrhizobium sp. BRP19]|uniref:transcriptional regulator GcvA n=1 Tax=Bradyrhizobium sp. BRP19 TaxID=2793823 RepID=UPI001CD2ACEE|nr:transcriptional regulator GcvA [Bradyrhizobium sp. BRP19]MCA1552258.1 transcriptional regulator GcvA [Bradyrhizobium sp. BRP19]